MGPSRHPSWSPLGRMQFELSFSPGFFSGSIVKAQHRLALCPARYVMWHEARWRSRGSRNRTAAWTGSVCPTSVPLWSPSGRIRTPCICLLKAAGRSIRHHALNELVARALSAAVIPNTKEPQGLCRSDGKRPDRLTLVPWQSGRSFFGTSQLSVPWQTLMLPRLPEKLDQ